MSAVPAIESYLERLECEWGQLAESSGATPFHHPGWVRAWSSAFSGNRGLMLLTLRSSNELKALMPLCVTSSRLVSPTNWHTPVFGPIADGAESTRELFDALFSLEARSVDLSLLDADDGTLGLAAGSAERAGRLISTRSLARSPWVALEGSWEDYERGLSRNRRKGIRRRQRRLEDRGTVELEVWRGGSDLGARLEEAFHVEASGWKGRSQTAIIARPQTRSFYTEVSKWAAERGWLRLSFLRLNTVPIAFDLSLELQSVRYSVKAGYDAAFARYGPGVLLFHGLLRDAYEAGLERFELLGEEDDFKLGWTDRVSERAWLHASAPTTAGRVEATVIRARERVRPVVRRMRDLVAQ